MSNRSNHKVGAGTPGKRIKSAYKRRLAALPNEQHLSLKDFTKELEENGNEDVSLWRDAKKGAFNQKRTDAKVKVISEMKASAQAARAKKKK